MMKTGNGVISDKWYVVSAKRAMATRVAKAFALLLTTYHLSLTTLLAADFQISASLDRTQIALNEQAVLSVVVSGSGGTMPDPQIPQMPDFQVYNAGRSQNYTWVNGKASASISHSFVLTPSKVGTFTLPPVQVTSGGQTAESSPLTLTVAKGDPSAVQGSAREEGTPRPAAPAQGAPAVFITGAVDKTAVVVGEPIVFTFRLYNRVRLLSQPGYQPPEMTGFWTEDLPPQRNFTASVKGMPYNVIEIRTALFPSIPGKARVGSAQLAVSLENFGTDPFGSNFFSQFFGRAEEKVLRTDPIAITVKALPEPKPGDFKGAVGDYTLTAQVDKPKISVGQPLTLSLTVAGQGNIKSIPDITLPPLMNFRTFDASAATHIEKKDGMVAGSKVFKTVLIPTASGDLSIPSIPFSYYDLSARAYKSVRSKPLTIHVEAGSNTSTGTSGPVDRGASAASSSSQPSVRKLGDDIRYIHTPENLPTEGPFLYKRKPVLFFQGLLVFLLAAGGLIRLYQRLFLSNSALYRFKKAKETAFTRIAALEGFLSRHDTRGATSLVANVLQDFMAAKLGVERRSQSLKEIVEGLRSQGLSPHTAEKVRSVWETLDLFQFAPAQVQDEELRAASRKTTHVIEEVEKEILWKK